MCLHAYYFSPESVLQVAPPETFHDIYTSVVTSPSKTYFISILLVAIGIIFIVGLSCGRVTKRVRAEMKNKWLFLTGFGDFVVWLVDGWMWKVCVFGCLHAWVHACVPAYMHFFEDDDFFFNVSTWMCGGALMRHHTCED